MITLDQMAKAAYEEFQRRGALSWPWENLSESGREDWRAAIRAALSVGHPDSGLNFLLEKDGEVMASFRTQEDADLFREAKAAQQFGAFVERSLTSSGFPKPDTVRDDGEWQDWSGSMEREP